MVANDLCIKAKNRCGSVKQSSFQWFGVFRATRHFYTSNRGFAVTRVGSHVVFPCIHCTDVRIHCTDIQIECR